MDILFNIVGFSVIFATVCVAIYVAMCVAFGRNGAFDNDPIKPEPRFELVFDESKFDAETSAWRDYAIRLGADPAQIDANAEFRKNYMRNAIADINAVRNAARNGF